MLQTLLLASSITQVYELQRSPSKPTTELAKLENGLGLIMCWWNPHWSNRTILNPWPQVRLFPRFNFMEKCKILWDNTLIRISLFQSGLLAQNSRKKNMGTWWSSSPADSLTLFVRLYKSPNVFVSIIIFSLQDNC